MPEEYHIKSEKELAFLAGELLNKYPEQRVFAFFGAMGAGKTTFIKEICRFLGVEDEVQSPTFTLIHEYPRRGKPSVYHVDFYRIKKQEEIYATGIEETLNSGHYCFIEWPEKMEELLPEDTVFVNIGTVERGTQRIISF